MQVHDELVLEVDEDAIDEVTAMLRREMAAAGKLAVPLKVDIGTGDQLGRGTLNGCRNCRASNAGRKNPRIRWKSAFAGGTFRAPALQLSER